ncbi:glycosyltransferase [Mixta sp.]|uniref:glycosyltransferase family 2 protein n=1 Tax=Mixta sp. TaxID=2100765 RepID=UPI002587F107|nr:glycosyltransferase [Mixta sp.]MCR1568264.1 hypothetical protein [Mixta sp.]
MDNSTDEKNMLNHPYYIMSPDYRESSGGIQVLHKLCHRINLQGGEAWMVGCSKFNPDWQTPVLTMEKMHEHTVNHKVAIAVYPEIVVGNPLNAKVCVRYMLNHEGLLNGTLMEEGVDDLFFWYSSQLIVKEPNPDFLTLVGPDMSIFFDDGREKTSKLLYLNRVPEACVDFSRLPADIKIISVQKPLPLHELAEILKGASVMYTYEWSGTCNLAALCGTPVVAMVAPGYEKLAISAASLADMGNAGVSWSDDEASLDAVRQDIYKVKEQLQKYEDKFYQQLGVFFAKTQQAAQRLESVSAAERLDFARLIHQPPADINPAHGDGAALLFIILANELNAAQLDDTLTSLAALKPYGERLIRVAVIATVPVSRQDVRCLQLDEERSFDAQLRQLMVGADAEWLTFMQAGEKISQNSYPWLMRFLSGCEQSYAVYSDKLFEDKAGSLEAALLPTFDLDMFISLPAISGRNWIYKTAFVQQVLDEAELTFSNPDLALIACLVETRRTETIRHFPEPLFVVKSNIVLHHHADAARLKKMLNRLGYQHAEIGLEYSTYYRAKYHRNVTAKISAVIIADDDLDTLQQCVTSFIQTVPDYDYELIIINNGCRSPVLEAWFQGLSELDPTRFRVLSAQDPQKDAFLFNQAVAIATGDVMLKLDPQLCFEQPHWVGTLIDHLFRSDVGAVSGKLIKSSGKIYSAGMIMGFHHSAFPVGFNEPVGAQGYCHRFNLVHAFSTLSGEMLMIKRERLIALGGVDESFDAFQESINDLCLQLGAAGLKNIMTPFAVARIQRENPSSLHVSDHDRHILYARWLNAIADDPAYHPHLSLSEHVYRHTEAEIIAGVTHSRKKGQTRSLACLFARPEKAAAAQFICNLRMLEHAGEINLTLFTPRLDLIAILREKPQVVILDNACLACYQELEILRHYLPDAAFLLFVADTLNIMQDAHFLQAAPLLNKIILRNKHADAIPPGFENNAIYLADALHPSFAETTVRKANQQKPRVGLFLNDIQENDWKFLLPVVKELADEMDIIVYGEFPQAIRAVAKEYHRKVNVEKLPQTLCALDLELALFPAVGDGNDFASGSYMLLAVAATGCNVLCSDVKAYYIDAPVIRLKNKKSLWKYSIRKMLENRASNYASGLAMREKVLSHSLFDAAAAQQWLTQLDATIPSR